MSVSPSPSTYSASVEPRRVIGEGSGTIASSSWMRWVRLAVVAMILAVSGGTRFWQERRLEQTLQAGRVSPFRLADLPMDLGDWKGQNSVMNPTIIRGTGSSDMISRRYVNQRTGVAIDAVVLYGPTSEMFIHTPEVCYPAAGFDPMDSPVERPIVVESTTTSTNKTAVPFRSLAFTKGEGGLADIQEVYYSLWYDGGWTTRTTTPKASQRIPGMYKVQIARRISAHERRDIDNPCESFLASLIVEIEARMARNHPVTTTSSTTSR